ncbi:hypothetical protein [Thermococcus sp.]
MILIFTPPQGDELGKDVARSVMQAALGVEDPCDKVRNKNGGFTTKEYDWNYTVGGSKLVITVAQISPTRSSRGGEIMIKQ